MDSPGFSATKSTYVLMDTADNAIVAMETVDKREAPKRASTNMEKVGFYRALKSLNFQVAEVVTDGNLQIQAAMSK